MTDYLLLVMRSQSMMMKKELYLTLWNPQVCPRSKCSRGDGIFWEFSVSSPVTSALSGTHLVQ